MSPEKLAVICDRIFTGEKWVEKGVIFISGGSILSIEEINKGLSVLFMQVGEIKEIYYDWEMFYSPGCYALPGLTDLTIRTSSDCEKCLSASAYMGGVLHGFIEVPKETAFSYKNLFQVQVISHKEELHSSSKHIKLYLSQPDCHTPHIEDTAEIIFEGNELGKVIIIDCSINDPRRLAMASPFRTEPDNKRLVDKVYSPQVFGNSLEINLKKCGSDEESDSDEDILKKKSTGNEIIEAELGTYKTSGKTLFSNSRSPSGLKRPTALVIPDAKRNLGYDGYLHNIPRAWELNGVKHVTENILDWFQVHFSNISCSETIEYLSENMGNLPNVTWETSPNYLFFNNSHVNSDDTSLKTYPPIRDQRNQSQLFQYCLDGKIPCISSHHNYVKPEYKIKEFARAIPGINSLGYGLSAMWTLSPEKNDKTIENIIKIMSINTSKVAKVESKIFPGGDASFILWNPQTEKKRSGYGYSPYSEIPLRGEVNQVFLKGDLVYSI